MPNSTATDPAETARADAWAAVTVAEQHAQDAQAAWEGHQQRDPDSHESFRRRDAAEAAADHFEKATTAAEEAEAATTAEDAEGAAGRAIGHAERAKVAAWRAAGWEDYPA